VIAALVAGRFLVPTSKDPSAPRLDFTGTVLSAAGLLTLLYGIIEAPTKGWGDSGVLAGFVAGALLLAAFILWESRSDHPMLDVRFFKNPRFSGASFAVTLVFFAMFGVSFLLTQYLQFVLGYSALAAGLGFIPVAAALMIAAPLSAPLTTRVGSKVSVAGGLAGVAVALAVLSRATAGSGYLLIGIVLALLGLSMGTAMAPATDSIMGSLPLAKAGVGSAVNDTTRQVGGALGVAILGSLSAAVYHTRITASGVLQSLPATARAAVHDSLGGAVSVAARAGAAGRPIAVAANRAFVHAMSITAMAAAGIALLGALVALVYLPARPAEEQLEEPADETLLDELTTTSAAGGEEAAWVS
jgi:Na+/melibiose symporter-like transporter